MQAIDRRLADLSDSGAAGEFGGIRRGLEKESLRIRPDGWLAHTPHPAALGSALTHPHITTDFSEALLEFISPALHSAADSLDFIADLHAWTIRRLDDELLWCASMPCRLGEDDQIPLARYGSSNAARMKTIYRNGLGHRYGRRMQTISGIHYNFSLPDSFWRRYQAQLGDAQPLADFITDRYFGMLRNFRRWAWLPLYLFGASPALCGSFLGDRPHQLQSLGSGTLYAPHGTALRMGGLGYTSDAQRQLQVSYNSLQDYAAGLRRGLVTPWPAYQAIGVEVDGEYRQLSDTLLQIEDEFYANIRPKRTAGPGEPRLKALVERGVEYVEVRLLDVNPFIPLGVDENTLQFLDAFLIGCLLADSPAIDAAEEQRIAANWETVVNRGREPGLQLQDGGQRRPLQAWGSELLEALRPIAELLDQQQHSDHHRHSLAWQQRKLDTPELTPSAQVLRAIAGSGDSFFRFAMEQSRRHLELFRLRNIDPAREQQLGELAGQSLDRQAELEAADTLEFGDYLRRYRALAIGSAP